MKLKKKIQMKTFFNVDVSELDDINIELKKLADDGKKIIYTKYLAPTDNKPYQKQLLIIFECDNI